MFDRIVKLKVYSVGGVPALNKPLLLLQALADAVHGSSRLQPFSSLETIHKAALFSFGLNKSNPNPAYAFWRLQSDKLWEVKADTVLQPRSGNSEPTITELRRGNARGGFKQEDYDALSKDPSLADQAIRQLLSKFFPHQLHNDIISFFGLYVPEVLLFRNNVLAAYQNGCCVTRQGLTLGATLCGLEAVPIRWPGSGGPFEVRNGVALTSHLASAFLMGGFTIVQQGSAYRVLKSSKLRPSVVKNGAKAIYGGEKLFVPDAPELLPSPDFLDWHRSHVFVR